MTFTTSALKNGKRRAASPSNSPGIVATAAVAGSPYVITPSNATGGTFTPSNYAISYVNGVLMVLPVPLVIKANDASKPYGTAITLPVTAFTSTGLKNGDTVTSVIETSPGTVAPAPVAGSPASRRRHRQFRSIQLHHQLSQWPADGNAGAAGHQSQ